MMLVLYISNVSADMSASMKQTHQNQSTNTMLYVSYCKLKAGLIHVVWLDVETCWRCLKVYNNYDVSCFCQTLRSFVAMRG